MRATRQGGSRDPEELYDNLIATADVDKKRIILVDVVRTYGQRVHISQQQLQTKYTRDQSCDDGRDLGYNYNPSASHGMLYKLVSARYV